MATTKQAPSAANVTDAPHDSHDDAPAAKCGCGAHEGAHEHGDDERHAVAVDPGIKDRNLKRLRRIEGQVRGLQKMVEEDRYCADILTQISSVHEALRSVGRELMRNHLKHCAASAIQKSGPDAEAMYDELVEMMYKHSR
jgi:CsoR family transcriptional regulator, copper-sensing transcriptional repressor